MSANAEVAAIVDAYHQHIRPNARLTDSARKKIQTRLKTYKADELIQAIQIFSAETWWMETNGCRGMAWFFNTDDRIESFLAMGNGEAQDVDESPAEVPVLNEWTQK